MPEESETKSQPVARLMKPGEIPIYGSPERTSQLSSSQVEEPGIIQSAFKSARLTLMEAWEPLKEVNQQICHVYETGKAHSQSAIAELQLEENLPMRAGVIAAGGIVGYVVGALRGRFFKKLFYSTIGLGSATAALYPQEARAITDDVYKEGKKLSVIAYNFVYGVAPKKTRDDGFKLERQPENKSVPALSKFDKGIDSDQSKVEDSDLYTTRDKNSS